jgi:hypothetical protein
MQGLLCIFPLFFLERNPVSGKYRATTLGAVARYSLPRGNDADSPADYFPAKLLPSSFPRFLPYLITVPIRTPFINSNRSLFSPSALAMNRIKAAAQLPVSTPTKKTLPFSAGTPIKGESHVPSADPFWTPTPEKPVQPPRRGCGVSVALSVNEVKQAALRLRKKDQGLALVEKQLCSDKAVKLGSSQEKDKIELPHK